MQRGGQAAAGREIVLPAGLVGKIRRANEVERSHALEAIGDADSAGEIEQFGAAAHADVLAVVDQHTVCGIDE